MINLKVSSSFNIRRFLKESEKGIANSLQHAAAIVRKDVKASLSVDGNGKPSKPGTPPHRQSGKLQRSIFYGFDGDNEMVVGSMPRSWGWYGRIHEHGGRLKTKNPILKVYKVGEEGWASFARGSKKITLRSDAQAERATLINRWRARKAAQGRYFGSRTDVRHRQDADSYAKGYEPEYEKIEDAYVNVPARPFVRPALMRNLGRIPYSFKDAI